MRINVSEAGRDMKNTEVYAVEVWPWVCDECGIVMVASYQNNRGNCEYCTGNQVRRAGKKQRVAVVLKKPFPKNLKAEPVRQLT